MSASKSPMKVLVFPRHDGRWCWALHCADGLPLAVSTRSFSTYGQAMIDCREAIGGMRDAMVIEDDGSIPIPGPEHLVGLALRR